MPEHVTDLNTRMAIVDQMEAEIREELRMAAFKIKACRERRCELRDALRQAARANGALATC